MARREVTPYVGPQLAEAIISQEAFAGVDNVFDKQYASVFCLRSGMKSPQ